ncbi:cell division protein ZapA [Shewanella fodinae]|nr:cell division protein ZapA [Shewanella fodinae]
MENCGQGNLHFTGEAYIVRLKSLAKGKSRNMSNCAVDISLMGRTYSIACPKGQEQALQSVARQLEQQLEQIKVRTPALSREDMVLMAALNIGHDLYVEQRKNQDYMQQMDERIRLLQHTLEQALVERSRRED